MQKDDLTFLLRTNLSLRKNVATPNLKAFRNRKRKWQFSKIATVLLEAYTKDIVHKQKYLKCIQDKDYKSNKLQVAKDLLCSKIITNIAKSFQTDCEYFEKEDLIRHYYLHKNLGYLIIICSFYLKNTLDKYYLAQSKQSWSISGRNRNPNKIAYKIH